MNRKYGIIKRLLVLLICVGMILITLSVRSEAASFSITSGISSITVGQSYNIKITATGLTGRFDISHSSNVTVNVSSVWVENGVADSTIKVTTKSTGKATVTITAQTVANATTGEVLTSLGSKTDTVTVKAKATTNSSGSNGSSSNSNKGSSSNSSSKPQTTTAPSFSSVNETVYATDSVNVRASYSTSSRIIGSLDVGDSIKRTGVTTRSINGIRWSRVSYNGQTAYVSSEYLNTEKPEEEKSNNKDLKSLEVDGYEITPEFSADVTQYSLIIDENVDVLNVKAVADDEKAKVEITGNDNLLIGENTIEIKVIAEDETEKTYKINVTKGEEPELELSKLTVEGYNITPEFKPDVHEYTLTINDVNVTSLNLEALSDMENASVEIAGNTDLELGENIITILVKSEDGEETSTYQIVVNIEEPVVVEEENQLIHGISNDDLYFYGAIVLGGLLLIIIIVIIAKHKNKDDDYETFNAGFTSLEDDKKKDNKDDFKNEEKKKEKKEKREKIKKEDKKSIIEENFGEDIDNANDDDTNKKRGKHF